MPCDFFLEVGKPEKYHVFWFNELVPKHEPAAVQPSLLGYFRFCNF